MTGISLGHDPLLRQPITHRSIGESPWSESGGELPAGCQAAPPRLPAHAGIEDALSGGLHPVISMLILYQRRIRDELSSCISNRHIMIVPSPTSGLQPVRFFTTRHWTAAAVIRHPAL